MFTSHSQSAPEPTVEQHRSLTIFNILHSSVGDRLSEVTFDLLSTIRSFATCVVKQTGTLTHVLDKELFAPFRK